MTTSKKQIFITNSKPIANVINLNLFNIQYLPISLDLAVYQYIIVSSQNALLALEKLSLDKFHHLKVISIGDSTSKLADTMGLQVILQSPQANAKALAKIVLTQSMSKKILYLRAKKISFDIKAYLKTYQFYIDDYICYKTSKNRQAINSLCENAVIIFTSAKAIQYFFEDFKWQHSYIAVCIGAKTAAVLPNGIPYKIAKKPNIASCLELAKKL